MKRFVLPWLIVSFAVGQDDCPLTMWVYDSIESCDQSDPPTAVGILFADGKCRSIEQVDPSSPSYKHFPGFYTAICTANGQLRIENAGCTTATCNSGPNGTCDVDKSAPGYMFAAFDSPEYLVQEAELARSSFFTCYELRSRSSAFSITFLIVGNCTQPSCQQQQHSVPTMATETSPPPVTTLSPPPLAWLRLTSAPTPAPKLITTTTTSARRPVGSPMPTIMPTTTTVAPTVVATTTTTRMLTSQVGLQLSAMRNDDMPAATLAVWSSVTADHITTAVHVVQATRIARVVQTVVAADSCAALQIYFDVSFLVHDTRSTEYGAQEIFRQAFDEEKERIRYVRELVRNNATAFESLNQVLVLGEGDESDDGVGNIYEDADRSSKNSMAALVASVCSVWVLACCFFTVFCIVRRRLVAAIAVEDGETADMSTMAGSLMPT